MENRPTDGPFVGSDFTPEDFTAIGSLLAAAGGLILDYYNAPCVKRRMAQRIRDLKLPGAQAYIELLRADRGEIQRLSAFLSLHVSTFYRDPSTFAALREILRSPPLSPAPADVQRWWSAGCAGGEEAYSLALLAAGLPDIFPRVELLATDISHEVLEKARYGLFAPLHLQNVSGAELAQAFTPEGTGFRIRDVYREMVRYVRHDLLADAPYPSAALILCRYVLIYFNASDQERVLGRFAAALPVGGILVLGRTETLRDRAGLFRPINAVERIYQRI